jgi:hypothetical protein
MWLDGCALSEKLKKIPAGKIARAKKKPGLRISVRPGSGVRKARSIRPVAGQELLTDLFVECSKTLSRNYADRSNFCSQIVTTR